jgi:polyribonucleotide nucleotidyltransferase
MATTNNKEKMNMNNFWNGMKEVVKDVNQFALEASDDLIDGALKTGTQWQKIAARATQGTLELTAKQQDINFETAETLKKQFKSGFRRFKKIFS